MKQQKIIINDQFLINYFSGRIKAPATNQLQEWITESQDNLDYYIWLQRLWIFRK